MKTIKKLSMLFLATFVLASCSNDDDTAPDNPPIDPPTLNIVETAQATDALSMLVEAVIKAELVTTLSGTDEYTVLAPTNAAFQAFLATTPWTTIDEVPGNVLSNVLLNHVITGNVSATDIITLGSGYIKTNSPGPTQGSLVDVYYSGSATAGVVFNGASSVTQADVAASNGTVHIVDTVISSTLTDFAAADPNFLSLALAATDDGQEDVIGAIALATPQEPLTIFAPTNEAFTTLLVQLGVTSVSDVDDATLNNVLFHHAVGGNVTSDALENGMVVQMANLQSISIMLPSDQGNIATITSGDTTTTSEVTSGDIQAINGVYHVVDTVLMPML